MRTPLNCLICIIIISLCHLQPTYRFDMKFSYPKARRDESVVDDYHGHKVADPYRWLEDPDAKETVAFVDAQNSISQPFIEQCPRRQKIHESLTEKWNFAKYSSPAEHGGSYYYYCNSGLQNQSVLYVQDTLKSEPRVFLDPNSLSEDGTLSISGTAFSEDGSYFAYGLSKCGSDWITIQFKKAPSAEDLPDTLKHVKFSSMAWTHDNKGMFYNRYPVDGKSDGTETTTNLYNKLYYHKLGTEQDEDILTVQFQNEPKWKMHSTEVSDSYSYHNQWQSPNNTNYTNSYGSTYVMSGTAMAATNEWQRPIFGACAPPSYLSQPLTFASGGISCSSNRSVEPSTSQKGRESSVEMKKKKIKKEKKQDSKCQKSSSPNPYIQNSSDSQQNCNKLNNNTNNYNNNMSYCQNYGWGTQIHGYQNGWPYSPNPTGHYNQQNSLYSGSKEPTVSSYGDYSQLNMSSNNNNNYSTTTTNNCIQNYYNGNSNNYNISTTGSSNNNIKPINGLSSNSSYSATEQSNSNQNSYFPAMSQPNIINSNNYPVMVQSNNINNSYYPAVTQPNNINNSYYPAVTQPNNINSGYMFNSSPTSHYDLPHQQYNTNNTEKIPYQYQKANTGYSSVRQDNNSFPLNSGQQQGSWYSPTTYSTTWQQPGNYSYSEPQNSSLYSTSSVVPVSNSFNSICPSYQSPPSSPTPLSSPQTSNTFTQSSPSSFSNQAASYSYVGDQSYSQAWYQYGYPYYGGYPNYYSYPYYQYTSSVSCSDNAQVKYEQRNVHSGILKSGEKGSVPETIFVPNYRGAEVSVCGKYLLLSPNEGCDPVNRLFYVELDKLPNGITENLPYVKLVDNFDAQYDYITNEGSVFTFLTNLNAPKYKIINIDFEHPEPENWKTLVEEDKNAVLEWASCVNQNKLVLCYLKDVKNKLYIHQLETGKLEAEIPLDIGTIIGCSGRKKSKEIFIHFMSFLTPGIIYHVDMTVDKPTPEVFRVIKVNNFDFSQFEVKQVFYPSKDGTKIPMFLVHKKNLVLNGNTPTFLYGYGGFDISIKPTFSVSRLVFLKDLDGVYALANIRGGGEYGEKWHKSGTHAKKQNVFDDFHAAAEYLIKQKYTCSKKLVIHGQSNGGLLVAACINQRPELYGVALAQVGVMDMFRFHKFTIGHAWTTDFGCSDIPEQFEFLKKYSPLHNIRVPKADIQYPSTLLLTADHDDRVVPLHSLKFIAELQHTMAEQTKQTNPLLIKIDTKAGHGRGKPTAMIIQEQTDMYCFIVKTLGLEWYKS